MPVAVKSTPALAALSSSGRCRVLQKETRSSPWSLVHRYWAPHVKVTEPRMSTPPETAKANFGLISAMIRPVGPAGTDARRVGRVRVQVPEPEMFAPMFTVIDPSRSNWASLIPPRPG